MPIIDLAADLHDEITAWRRDLWLAPDPSQAGFPGNHR
jgi:hypothetical protein